MTETETIISLIYYPILFSFSLSLVLPTMINLFKKNTTSAQSHRSVSGLGLVTATRDPDRPPNVLESATLKPSNSLPPPTSPSPGEIGFIDEGLMSCTESLGFESSDERRIDDKMEDQKTEKDDDSEVWRRKMVMRAESRVNWNKVRRSFPPPLSSLNRNGKPCFFLRPVRKDGRLELTEVRIHRPEILHASRHDGRLTLRLIPDQVSLEEEEEEEHEQQQQLEEEDAEEMILDEEEEEEEEEVRYGNGREEGVAEWGFPVAGCHEMVNQQHQHHVHGNHHHHLRMCGISIV